MKLSNTSNGNRLNFEMDYLPNDVFALLPNNPVVGLLPNMFPDYSTETLNLSNIYTRLLNHK